MSKLELQLKLEQNHVKNHLYRRLNKYWKELGLLEAINNEYAEKYKDSEWMPQDSLIASIITQVYLAKRLPIQVAVGMFCNKYSVEDILFTSHILIDLGVVGWDGSRMVVKIGIPADLEKDLSIYQYPMPMIVEPEELTKNSDSGYLSFKKNVVLRMKDSNGDHCLDVLNILNSTAYSLDSKVTNFTESPWKSLDKPKPDETQDDYYKRKKAYEKYKKDSVEVINSLIMTTDEVWLTHSYDKRGRVYANGYHVNPYGADWNKAIIQFANKEIIA